VHITVEFCVGTGSGILAVA